jgi:TolB protein
MNNRRISLLASFKGTNSGGRYSPDGSRVVMVLSGEGNPEIYVGTASGHQIRRLTNTPAIEASPDWSPDGSRLVFASDAPGRPQLYMMSANGGGMTRVTYNVSAYCAEPDWNRADPNKIAFTAAQGRGYQIGVWDLASRSGKIVSRAPMDAIEPVWAGDGRHVICTFRAANTSSLYLLDTETGSAVRLSPTALGNASSATYLAP